MQEPNQPEHPATRDDLIKAKYTTAIPPKVLKALIAVQLAAESGKATQPATDGQLSFKVFSSDDVMRVAKPAFHKAKLAILPWGTWLRSRADVKGVEFTTVVRYLVGCDDEYTFCELEAPVFGDPSRELSHRVAGANTYAKKKWYEGILGLVQEDPNMPLEPNGAVHDTRGSYLSSDAPEAEPTAPSPASPATTAKPAKAVKSSAVKKREDAKVTKPIALQNMPEKLRPYPYEVYKKADKLSPRVREIVDEALRADSHDKMDWCINLFNSRSAEISPEESDIARPIIAVRKIEVHCATRPARLLHDWSDLDNRKDQLPKSDFEHLRARLKQAIEASGQPVPSGDDAETTSSDRS